MKRELIKLLRRLEKIPHRGTDVSVSAEFCGWDNGGVWRYSGAIFFVDNECKVSGSYATMEEVAINLEAQYAKHLHTK